MLKGNIQLYNVRDWSKTNKQTNKLNINYYTSFNTNIFRRLLDYTKAFDTIGYQILFSELSTIILPVSYTTSLVYFLFVYTIGLELYGTIFVVQHLMLYDKIREIVTV